MSHKLHILHLPAREDRKAHMMQQLEEQGIVDYRFVSGIVDNQVVFRGINLAHKRIVNMARIANVPRITICEDDIVFSAKGAWDYYLKNTPQDFDIYFGMVYQADVKDGKMTGGFSGLTLYTVHERFYDFFLNSTRIMNHLDRELGNFCHQNDYRVCEPMMCYQMDGFSDNKKKEDVYGHYLKGVELYGGLIVCP